MQQLFTHADSSQCKKLGKIIQEVPALINTYGIILRLATRIPEMPLLEPEGILNITSSPISSYYTRGHQSSEKLRPTKFFFSLTSS